MLFSSIPGLEETKSKLIQAIRHDHLAHALLIHGPEGSATLPMALGLATYVNCENPGEHDSCGTCGSCLKSGKLIHPDLNFAFPIPSISNKDGDEDTEKKVDLLKLWRSFTLDQPYGNLHDWVTSIGINKQLSISKGASKQLIQALSLKSFEGGYKIMLIWYPENMHTAAANAILKILEEPPEKTLFLLVCHHPEQLLTTIMSRTQKISIRAFSDEEIKTHLVTNGICDQAVADQLVPLADGNLREAYRLTEKVVDQNTAQFKAWMRECYTLNINDLNSRMDKFSEQDKESQKHLFLTGINVLRECLLDASQLKKLMRTAPEDIQFIEKFGRNTLSSSKILEMYEKLGDAHYHLERNGNPKILFMDLSLQLATILKTKEIHEENHR
jgi:DNA polymerase III subunit delta'